MSDVFSAGYPSDEATDDGMTGHDFSRLVVEVSHRLKPFDGTLETAEYLASAMFELEELLLIGALSPEDHRDCEALIQDIRTVIDHFSI